MRYFICDSSEETLIPEGALFAAEEFPKNLIDANATFRELSECDYYLLHTMGSKLYNKYLENQRVYYIINNKSEIEIIYCTRYYKEFDYLLHIFRNYKSADILTFYKLCLEKLEDINDVFNHRTHYLVGYNIYGEESYTITEYHRKVTEVPTMINEVPPQVVKVPWYRRVFSRK